MSESTCSDESEARDRTDPLDHPQPLGTDRPGRQHDDGRIERRHVVEVGTAVVFDGDRRHSYGTAGPSVCRFVLAVTDL